MTIKLRSLHPILVPTPNNEQPFIISLSGITEDGGVAVYDPGSQKWELLSMEVAVRTPTPGEGVAVMDKVN